MEELDKILITRKVNLGGGGDGYKSGGEDDKSESGLSVLSNLSNRSVHIRNEKFTESMIQHDVFGPHIVYFTPTSSSRKSKKRYCRLAVIIFVLVLSVSGILHLKKIISSLSHEAFLDIEVKMATAESTASTTDATTTTINDDDYRYPKDNSSTEDLSYP